MKNNNSFDPQEFSDFKNSESKSSHNKMTLEKVHEQILAEAPRLSMVLAQLLGLHLISSLITLMICPQFGIRLFFDGHGLMSFFMQAGTQGCFLLCGLFYLGTSFAAARLFFNHEEWIFIRKTRVLSATVLALLSMGVLKMYGEELNMQLSAMWFLGAYLGSWLASVPRLRVISKG